MSTPETVTPVVAEAPKKVRKSFSLQLMGPQGDVIKLVTRIKRDAVVTYVVHATVPDAKTKKRTAQRGCTVSHPDLASAKTTVDKLLASALKNGWKPKPTRPRGFQPKADSFAELPKPSKK